MIKFDRTVRLTSIMIEGSSVAPTEARVFVEGIGEEIELFKEFQMSATIKDGATDAGSKPQTFNLDSKAFYGKTFKISEYVSPSCLTCNYNGMVVFREKISVTYDEVDTGMGIAGVAGLATDMLSLLESQTDLHDVTFKCNGTAVTANKAILASRSNYFRSLLFGGCAESRSSQIDLADCPPDAFQAILQFLYAGGIRAKDPIALIGAHALADKYILPDTDLVFKHMGAAIGSGGVPELLAEIFRRTADSVTDDPNELTLG
jgi:hypothetical protein